MIVKRIGVQVCIRFRCLKFVRRIFLTWWATVKFSGTTPFHEIVNTSEFSLRHQNNKVFRVNTCRNVALLCLALLLFAIPLKKPVMLNCFRFSHWNCSLREYSRTDGLACFYIPHENACFSFSWVCCCTYFVGVKWEGAWTQYKAMFEPGTLWQYLTVIVFAST